MSAEGAGTSANSNLRGAGYMTLSMAAYTLNDTCVKLLSDSVPVFQLIFLRGVLTAALIAAGLYLWRGLDLRIPRADRGKIALRSGFELASTLAILLALANMPLANVTAILAALPLFLTLGAWLVFRQPVGLRRIIAIATGSFGVMLIVQPGSEAFNIYALSALAGVLLVTGRDLVTRSLSAEVPSISVAVVTAVAVALFGAVGAAAGAWVPIGPAEAGLVALASVFIVGGYVFSILVMRVGEIAFTVSFRYTSLIWALILGIVVFGEFPNALALLGGAIVVASGLYTVWRERRIASGR